MANRDGKGPQGKGEMTGRKMGSCQGEKHEGQNVPAENGQGKQCGRGMRRGLGNRSSCCKQQEAKATNAGE